MISNIEVIAMVYKSVDYARFIANQLHNTRLSSSCRQMTVACKIIANDPTMELEAQLVEISKESGVKYDIYYDPKPDDYYLNRVYRCWNYCVLSSYCDNVCLVNSDMLFTQTWLTNLAGATTERTLPTSLLVESGKLLSGTNAISKNFGRHPNNIDHDGWQAFSETLQQTNKGLLAPGGLYMPCIFNRDKFLAAGGYPEGNIYKDGIGTRNGPVVQSGDAWFFDKYCATHGVQHVTVMDSVVYHIQEGEMDE